MGWGRLPIQVILPTVKVRRGATLTPSTCVRIIHMYPMDRKRRCTWSDVQTRPIGGMCGTTTRSFEAHKPNATTRKAIEDARAGRGMTRCENLEDMLRKLDE
jgi:hypothetical protein